MTALLGTTACGVTLDEENLALLGVFLGTIGQFAGQTASCHGTLSLYALTGLASSNTRRGGEHYFLAYLFGFPRMFLQVVVQCFANSLLDSTLYF